MKKSTEHQNVNNAAEPRCISGVPCSEVSGCHCRNCKAYQASLAEQPVASWQSTPRQTLVDCTLEINHLTGVVYAHLKNPALVKDLGFQSILRIYGLDVPIPHNQMLDLNFRRGKYAGMPTGNEENESKR